MAVFFVTLLVILLGLFSVTTTATNAATYRSLSFAGNDCSADIGNATKDVAAAATAIARSVSTCASGFTPQCNKDIAFTLQELTFLSADITAAVYDCAGGDNTPTQCSADINNALVALTAATTDIMNAVLDCQDEKKIDQCQTDTQNASSHLVDCAFAIVEATKDC